MTVSVDLPTSLLGVDLLAGNDPVHDDVRQPIQCDDDDDAGEDRIQIASSDQHVQRRGLTDLESKLKAARLRRTRHLHRVERVQHVFRDRDRHPRSDQQRKVDALQHVRRLVPFRGCLAAG